MSCCIPGCRSPLLQGWTMELPRDEELLVRWKAAIQAGTGQILTDESTRSDVALVCNMHFAIQQPEHAVKNEDIYQEPSLFIRDSVLLQVESCRLCLRYDTIDSMFNMEMSSIHGQSLQRLVIKYFKLLPSSKECVEKGFLCESCTVRIDMTHAFWLEINETTKEYRKLLRKTAKKKDVERNVSSHPDCAVTPTTNGQLLGRPRNCYSPSDGIQNPQAKDEVMSGANEIVVKNEPHFFQSDAPYDDEPTSAYENQDVLSRMHNQEEDNNYSTQDILVKEEPQLNEPNLQEMEDSISESDASPSKQMRRERVYNRTYKCYICGSVMENKEAEIHHLMTAHVSQDSYQCENCNLTFDAITKYNNHLSKHDVKKQFQCSVCPMRFMQKQSKLYHENAKHGVENGKQQPETKRVKAKLQCLSCDKSYFNKVELKRHEQVQHGKVEAISRCKVCGKTFASIRNLERHLKIHFNQPAFPCWSCDLSFRLQVDLVEHAKEAHNVAITQPPNPLASRSGGASRREPTCNVCQTSFVQSKEIVIHFLEVHPELKLKSYPCTDCDEVFFQLTSLHSHRYIHKNAYTCEQCGKQHYSAISLASHRHSVHGIRLDEDLYEKCPVCGREFIRGPAMQSHLRSHSDSLLGGGQD